MYWSQWQQKVCVEEQSKDRLRPKVFFSGTCVVSSLSDTKSLFQSLVALEEERRTFYMIYLYSELFWSTVSDSFPWISTGLCSGEVIFLWGSLVAGIWRLTGSATMNVQLATGNVALKRLVARVSCSPASGMSVWIVDQLWGINEVLTATLVCTMAYCISTKVFRIFGEVSEQTRDIWASEKSGPRLEAMFRQLYGMHQCRSVRGQESVCRRQTNSARFSLSRRYHKKWADLTKHRILVALCCMFVTDLIDAMLLP